MMDVVHAWANGASFAKLCEMTDVFEGNLHYYSFDIRCTEYVSAVKLVKL